MSTSLIVHGTLTKCETKMVGDVPFASMTVKSKRRDYVKRQNIYEEFKITTTGKQAQRVVDAKCLEGDEVFAVCEMTLLPGGKFRLYATEFIPINGDIGVNMHIVLGSIEEGTHKVIEREGRDDGEVVNARIRIPGQSRDGKTFNNYFRVTGWDARARGMKHLLKPIEEEEEDRRWALCIGSTSVRKYENSEGDTKYSTEIGVEKFEFSNCSTPKFSFGEAEQGGEGYGADDEGDLVARANADQYASSGPDDDDDLPF